MIKLNKTYIEVCLICTIKMNATKTRARPYISAQFKLKKHDTCLLVYLYVSMVCVFSMCLWCVSLVCVCVCSLMCCWYSAMSVSVFVLVEGLALKFDGLTKLNNYFSNKSIFYLTASRWASWSLLSCAKGKLSKYFK